MDKKGHSEQVIFKQRPEGSKGDRHLHFWRKSISDKENSKCKDLATRKYLMLFEEVNMSGAEYQRGDYGRQRGRKVS